MSSKARGLVAASEETAAKHLLGATISDGNGVDIPGETLDCDCAMSIALSIRVLVKRGNSAWYRKLVERGQEWKAFWWSEDLLVNDLDLIAVSLLWFKSCDGGRRKEFEAMVSQLLYITPERLGSKSQLWYIEFAVTRWLHSRKKTTLCCSWQPRLRKVVNGRRVSRRVTQSDSSILLLSAVRVRRYIWFLYTRHVMRQTTCYLEFRK